MKKIIVTTVFTVFILLALTSCFSGMFQKDTWIYDPHCTKNDSLILLKIKKYTEAINLNPKDVVGHFNRGKCLMQIGDNDSYRAYRYRYYKKAKKDFEEVLKLSPNAKNMDTVCFYRGASIYKYEITEDKHEAKVNNGANGTGFGKSFTTIKREKELKEAVVYFNKSIELNPNYADAYFLRGVCDEKTEEMIADFTKAIKFNTNYLTEAYYKSGLCKFDLNDKNGGCEDIEKAISLGSTDAQFAKMRHCK